MQNKITGIILLVVLAGCDTVGSNDDERSCLISQATYSYEYDQISDTGLTLMATGDEYTFISFEEMIAEYIELEACVVNNNTPGPTVIFTGFNAYGFKYELALYHYARQIVFIDTDQEDWLPQRNCISDREFLRHEFTHHVLFLNGQDPEHTNPAFASCKSLGPKSCNGQYCE